MLDHYRGESRQGGSGGSPARYIGARDDHEEAGAIDTIFPLRGPESPQALPEEDIGARENREAAAPNHSVEGSSAPEEIRARSRDRPRAGDCPGCDWRPGHCRVDRGTPAISPS